MSKRDRAIIEDLERFRVMSRDDIIDLYFSHLKNPITNANTVLKRLVRDGKIEVSRSFNPFVYLPYNSIIKKNSTKIPHFLKIVEIYKQIKLYDNPKVFQVEPKYQKGLAEPDVLTTIKGKPSFIEVQRNLYSQNVMDKKMKRYEALYYSNEFDEGRFPYIIMVSDAKYEINSDLLTVFQVSSIHEFMENATGVNKIAGSKEKKIQIKIG